MTIELDDTLQPARPASVSSPKPELDINSSGMDEGLSGSGGQEVSAPVFGSGGGSGSSGAGVAPTGQTSVSFHTNYKFQVLRVAGQNVGGNVIGTDALNARLRQISGIGVEPNGTVFVCDRANNQVRAFPAQASPLIVAGALDGSSGFVGDNITAVSARLHQPEGLVEDVLRHVIFICDSGNNRVRFFTPGGRIYTAAGGGSDLSDTVQAASTAALEHPTGIAMDANGSIYFTERDNGRVRKLSPSGTLTTVIKMTPGQIGPIAVSSDGSRLWASEGQTISLLHPQESSAAIPLPLNGRRQGAVIGLAYDQASTLYVATAYTAPDGSLRTEIDACEVNDSGNYIGNMSVLRVAGSDANQFLPDSYDGPVGTPGDAREQVLGGSALCGLSIDLNDAGTADKPSGNLYFANDFDDAQGNPCAEVLELRPTM